MNKRAQRVAIAKACGWKEVDFGIGGNRDLCLGDRPEWVSRKIVSFLVDQRVPDYLNDLNACHEMERVLTPEQREFYASILGGLTYNDNGRGWQPLANDDCFPILHATAAQRCEAFLRALNLWTE